ncbi:MAG TPA: ferrous iron transport protein B [Armatimonadota bacterium]|jgi:ferrous iron transport protein B|nr:ferrous iron transport protein B [Armatimonadota bacterium]HOJ21997.1 ferrous iron transport protein B [Armatimonadota bacterium]HOM82071.1 ferrous iron transport protein B [Armatimonadota bacterium]HPO71231.1 ferrous iron transport protein B [Armatimonadota bacterium]HPT97070.1 ferrous iron transport protein B [Armatimonadota bacterium]
MHTHDTPLADPSVRRECRSLVLAGNPNTGKSVFFNFLTGIYVDVSNYPGTTIEVSRGRCGEMDVIDTPGVYGVSSFNDEERVARDIILEADVVLNVVDAVHLERDLFLTLQLIDMGIPMVVALNLMDEAKREGVSIDVDLLSDLLGVPVIPTVATRGEGLCQVQEAIASARPGHSDPQLLDRVHEVLREVGSRPEAVLVLEGDPVVSERHGVAPRELREEIYARRRMRVNDIVRHVVREESPRFSLSAALGRWTLHPVTGLVTLAAVLWVMYQFLGVFIAQTVVGYTEGELMQGYWEPWARATAARWFGDGSLAHTLLVGEFGVVTMTVTYLLGLLLPLVAGFYFSLSILEDSGYLPRLATLVDRFLTGLGLNGRAVVPIILGFGCITMATITTRLLGTVREKRIATAILNFTIPCSAQLGVITALLARAGGEMALAYVVVIGSCLVLVGTLLNRALPGESSPLLIDLPPMRLPRIENVLRKTVTRTYHFLREASGWFVLGSFVVVVMSVTGLLELWQSALSPMVVSWLQLPREAANAFVMGMVRRDFGAAGLAMMPLTAKQTLVALVTMTLFVPCIASVAILLKERGRREALIIWGASWILAFAVGGLVSQIVIR